MSEKEKEERKSTEGGTLVDMEGEYLEDLIKKKKEESEEPPPLPEEEEKVETKQVQIDEEEEEEIEKTVLMDLPKSEEVSQAPSPSAKGRILITSGNDRGKEFFLTQKTSLVGRSLECDIVINDPSVSRKHFNIIQTDHQYKLIDLGSGNGTKVNGVNVHEIELTDGMQIECGTTSMSFNLYDPEATRILDTLKPEPEEMPTRFEQPVIQIPEKIEFKPPPSVTMPEEKRAIIKKLSFILTSVIFLGILVTVVGHLILGWRFVGFLAKKEPTQPLTMEVSKDRISEEELEMKKREAEKSFRKGQEFFRNKEWDNALIEFNKTKEIYADIEGVDDSINKAKIEKEAKEKIENGIKLVNEKNYSQAKEVLQKVPEYSVYFMDVRNYLKEIDKKQIEERIGELEEAFSKGKKEEVKKGILSLLGEFPESELVVSFKNELEKKGLNLYEKEMPKKPQPVEEKVPKKVVVKVEGDAFTLYNSGNFVSAEEKFREMAQKTKNTKEASQYLLKAEAAKDFSVYYLKGKNSAQKYMFDQAIPSLLKSMELDSKINGHYQKEIKRLLSEMYSYSSAEKFSKKNYGESAIYIKKALSLSPDDEYAKGIEQKLYQKAYSMYNEAKVLIEKGNKQEAKELLRQIIKILPMQDEIYKESYRLINKLPFER